MFRFLKIYKNQYFGIWLFGILLFALQEIPYIVMPFLKLESNPLMNMSEPYLWLDIMEKAVGVSCVLLLFFVVEKNQRLFITNPKRDVLFMVLAFLSLFAYYGGWIVYFLGNQSLFIMLFFLCAMPPLYYSFIGLWRKNWSLSIFGILFLIVHVIHVWTNFTL